MTTRGRGGQSAGRKSSGRRRPGDRKKNRWLVPLIIILVVADLIFMLIFGIRHWLDKRKNESPLGPAPEQEQIEGEMPEGGGDGETGESGEPAGEDGGSAPSEEEMGQLFAQSDRMAMHYDYDGAIELINSSPFAQNPEAQSRIESYEATKATLVPANNSEITHVFFHILIVDPELALTDDPRGEDFNQVMTSIPEFEAILSEMYARGYVLVGLHDIAEIQKDENGQEHMVQKQIMLPEGKKPFVMSQDDVCYYEYMEGCGFADKMVLDENGKLKLQYTERDGTVSIGDYDLVPILDRFVEEHPDFSYHGHKAIIAFTGYNGVLGYRTDESYDPNSGFYDPNNTPNENLEADRQTVRELTKALVEDGYELSSHSWGHVNFTTRDLAALTKDTDRWERNVESLLPAPCDILLYPFGADIKDWHPYDHGNEKFNMLEAAGFRYFCNVDSNEYWVQFGDNFMRQGRRNLDGYRLYEAYSGGKNRVSDLMDVTKVFDTRRPVPIGWKD